MIETHGGVQHVELAPQLWCVVFFPLAAAVAVAYFGLMLGEASEKEKTEAELTIKRIAFAGPIAALLTLLFYAYELSRLAANSRYFLLHFANLLRVGQLDANVDFALDPLSASFAIVIAALGGIVTFLLASRKSDAKKKKSWRMFARLDACIGAALFFVLADNFPLALVAWGATGALVSSLAIAKADRASRARSISFLFARISDVALLVAAASLFWTFGGTFSEGDYVPDLDARYAAVSNVAVPTAPTVRSTPNAKSAVTLASTPGALLFIDESHTPIENAGAPARSPVVRQAVDAGMHTFRVHPGLGADDSIVAHVRFVENAEVALVLVGATANFREMRDQLALVDDHGSPWRKDALIARRAFGSLGSVTFACLMLLLAAALRGAAVPFETWLAGATDAAGIPAAVLVQAVAACTGIYLLARISFLLELSPVASTVVASVGALTAVVGAAAACASSTVARFVGHLAASQFGFALLALGVGSPVDAVVIAVIASLAIAALALAFVRETSRKNASTSRLIVAALAVAPVPGVGVSFAIVRALGAAFVSDRIVGIPGAVFVAFGAAGAALTGFACWKLLYITYNKEPKKAEKSSKKSATKPIEKSSAPSETPSERNIITALTGAALFAGLIFDLGILSGHPFTTDASWFARWLTPTLTAASGRESSAVDGLVFALGFGGALAGFAHARNQSLKSGALEKIDPRLEAWATNRTDGTVLTRAASAVVVRASLLARDTDRFVIDGVIGAGSGIVRLAARLTGGRGQG
jgi:NADH:ubiquinone oxidoreductase subunit 5 (subunit L)/multisubunit Na+/H+ antiporter MnhA subunit